MKKLEKSFSYGKPRFRYRGYKPLILISRCLNFQNCRYDGSRIFCAPAEILKKWLAYRTVCPESDIGLPSPRPPLNLIKNSRQGWLVSHPDAQNFFQQQLRTKSRRYLRENASVQGLILKEKSPSCGIAGCKYYHPGNSSPRGRTAGLLTREARKLLPRAALISAENLKNPEILFYFLVKVYTWRRWENLRRSYSPAALQVFQARHKLLFLGFNRQLVDEMGRIIAAQKDYNQNQLIACYEKLLDNLLQQKLTRGCWINVLLHGFGHLSGSLNKEEKKEFRRLIQKFKKGETSYWSLHNWLESQSRERDITYLLNQKFLFPYPPGINNELATIDLLPDPFETAINHQK